MINSKRKTVLTAFVLTGSIIIILSIAESFRGFSSSHVLTGHQVIDSTYNIKSFKLPDEVILPEKKCLSKILTQEKVLNVRFL